MPMVRPRFIYLCNAVDEKVCEKRRITSDSPAATRKVLQVALALRQQAVGAMALSLGRGRQLGTGKWFSARATRVSGVPVVYGPFFDFPVITHFVTLLGLLPLVLRLRKRSVSPVILAYNRLPHYWLAMELARLFGFRRFLDLEDGETRTEKNGVRERIACSMSARFNKLCDAGAMLASNALKRQYPGQNTICCYGVAEASGAKRDWRSGKIVVLLGGTLQRDTGANLFIEAIELLRNASGERMEELDFVVTGKGEMASAIKSLADRPGLPKVIFLGSVSRERYRSVVARAHVGLCLKLPSSDLGDTTFPSKVVEIASSGLLLLTTRVSDVPGLFMEDGALYLGDESPEQLAGLLRWLIDNRDTAESIALIGQGRISEICRSETVGKSLKNFFFPSPH
jgi:Glycosyl transferases group 1